MLTVDDYERIRRLVLVDGLSQRGHSIWPLIQVRSPEGPQRQYPVVFRG